MKIILLTSSLALGGTERVVAGLCNDWAARGDAVTVIVTYSGGGTPFYRISPQAEVIYLANIVGVRQAAGQHAMLAPLLSYGARLQAMRRLIQERAPDVVVSFLPNVNIATILASVFLPVPVVICERSDPSGHRGFHVLKALRRLTYRYADVLLVQTKGAAEQAKRLYPGLKAVSVIPNPLPPKVASCAKAPPKDRKVLLSLGRLAPEKQIGKLIDAFGALAPRHPEWDLCIYGEGPEAPALATQIERLRLQGRVFLRGTTARPWEVMAAADAFAMVSRNEGFPNALLEAMGIGLPCVVFDCQSGPRDITRGGRDAFLVPLDNEEALIAALERLMADASLRQSLGKRARESVHARYSHVQVMKRWDELFQRVGASCALEMHSLADQG